MTDIIFLDGAKQDLAEINSYYKDTAHSALNNVLEDIYVVLEVLSIWPHADRVLNGEPGRRFVSPKYRFTVTYDY